MFRFFKQTLILAENTLNKNILPDLASTSTSFHFQISRKNSSFRNEEYLIEPNYKKFSYVHAKNDNLHLLSDTIGERVNLLSKFKPNDIAYKFLTTQVSYSFREVQERVSEMAQNLLNLGFKKGDRLAIMLPNVPESVISILAGASIGVIVVLMNPAYQLIEIEYMLKKTRAKGLIILDNLKILQHYQMLTKLCPELESSPKGELNSKIFPDLKHVVVVKNQLIKQDSSLFKGTWTYEEFSKFNSGNKFDLPHVEFEDPFVMLFTSGTTGLPKGAVLSHHNILNTSYLGIYTNNLIEEHKIGGCSIPIFHVFGLAVGVLDPLICGSKVVFPSFFPDTLALLKAIHTEKIRTVKAAPIIILDVINHKDRKNYDLSSLQYILLGASTVPLPLLLKIKEELKLKNLLVGLGLTETSAGGLCTVPSDMKVNLKHALESIGKPFSFIECKIIDQDGNLAPLNTDGEICFRGYCVMKGYWDEPAKTAETIDKNGWLKTGDIGCMDEEGYVYFKSRAKEVIIRGGINIYPAEIEAFIRTHPDVLDCYSFGVPDERVGEEVGIWIRLKSNESKINSQNIIDFCNGKIAYFKTPKYIKFVDVFPVNANGKVMKFKMTEQTKKELETQKDRN